MYMFNAALEARYPYQPPNLLSEILPTRALKHTTVALFSTSGTISFNHSMGITLFTVKYSLNACAEISSKRFSGSKDLSELCRTPVVTTTKENERHFPSNQL